MLNTVVVVDDSEDDLYLARRALRKADVARQVIEFSNAAAALELISNRKRFERECGPWPPRVVILVDINMPRMGGFEFLDVLDRRIHEGAIPTKVLVVAMYSTSNTESDLSRAKSSPIVMDYIVKPITAEVAARIGRAAESLDCGEGSQEVTA